MSLWHSTFFLMKMKLNFHNVISIIQQYNLWVTLWVRWNCYLLLIVGSIKTVWPLKILNGNGAAHRFQCVCYSIFGSDEDFHIIIDGILELVAFFVRFSSYFLSILQSIFLSCSLSSTHIHIHFDAIFHLDILGVIFI